MKETFGQRLSRLRKEKGFTQEDIASQVTISPQAVSKWENDISSPDISTLGQLADLLGVSVDELLGREEGEAKGEAPRAEKVETAKTEVVDDEDKFQEKKEDSIRIDDSGIHIHSEDGDRVEVTKKGVYVNDKPLKECRKEQNKRKTLTEVLASVCVLLGVIAYILAGFLWKDHGLGWSAGWTFILFGISLGSLLKVFEKKKMCSFAYPVFITAVYCLLGFLGAAYDFPGFGFYWFLFITIPVYYTIGHYVDQRNGHEDDDDEDED